MPRFVFGQYEEPQIDESPRAVRRGRIKSSLHAIVFVLIFVASAVPLILSITKRRPVSMSFSAAGLPATELDAKLEELSVYSPWCTCQVQATPLAQVATAGFAPDNFYRGLEHILDICTNTSQVGVPKYNEFLDASCSVYWLPQYAALYETASISQKIFAQSQANLLTETLFTKYYLEQRRLDERAQDMRQRFLAGSILQYQIAGNFSMALNALNRPLSYGANGEGNVAGAAVGVVAEAMGLDRDAPIESGATCNRGWLYDEYIADLNWNVTMLLPDFIDHSNPACLRDGDVEKLVKFKKQQCTSPMGVWKQPSQLIDSLRESIKEDPWNDDYAMASCTTFDSLLLYPRGTWQAYVGQGEQWMQYLAPCGKCNLTFDELDTIADIFWGPFAEMEQDTAYDHFLSAFVDPQTVVVDIDAQKHLSICAPETCEWIEQQPVDPEYLLLSLFGLIGGASAIVALSMSGLSASVDVLIRGEDAPGVPDAEGAAKMELAEMVAKIDALTRRVADLEAKDTLKISSERDASPAAIAECSP
jgi:hypothetical protein